MDGICHITAQMDNTPSVPYYKQLDKMVFASSNSLIHANADEVHRRKAAESDAEAAADAERVADKADRDEMERVAAEAER
ncbi:unnamed protein product [Microthlaspi erraticum]|uniref:Uncharacterized protein n=1 Tax=Microthlaspi erraticum TaxID=1685480 RepID=A0A6D2I6V4_9BRAS|nr:unnamed protein product [Microthlaspi erraticum]